MAEALILLNGELLESARAGRHNFIGRLSSVCEGAGMRVRYASDTPAIRIMAHLPGTYAATHMEPPAGRRGVVLRRAIRYPFWAIERSHVRWEWDMARASFARMPGQAPERFAAAWRRRLLGGTAGRGDAVLVPLQGVLTRRRAFQSMSPIEMLRAVLAQSRRPVVATLHPSESYGDADLAALRDLASDPRLTVRTGGSEEALRDCAYVATMNSSVAFLGFLLGRPAALFARSEFHHIAASAMGLGAAGALERAEAMLDDPPDYAGYVHWFWQMQCVNAGRPEAEDRIAERLRAAGWPM